MLDVHCHIDQYKNPNQLAIKSEKKGIITLGVTNLPTHYELGFPHVRKYKKVRLALGMHPLLANQHSREFSKFKELLDTTSYIGEVGLDYSNEGLPTKDIQVGTLKRIFRLIRDKKKIVSLHSRRAEKKVFELLQEYNIKLGIFHWYSGPLGLIDEISEAGYYFSVNTAMINSKKGAKIISRIPLSNLLVETDGPFIKYKGRDVEPMDVKDIYAYLAKERGMSIVEMDKLIDRNFNFLLKSLS